ncbi:hypothetical protein [Thermospira aquatica]|uniref:Transporter n=1 Tax=Thermospira aquatica TaxID=2828656 RepID=A0AAX3BF77_9SPIR|nr:hypothetical protein [Thermospira aquatica]URA10909.1 hypothetical protein KDW03_03660 [Thermospira aquatica]
MKRIVVGVFFGMLVTLGFGAPTYSGADGYIIVPSVDAAYSGRLGLSVKYTPQLPLTVAANFSPLSQLELGAGIDISTQPTSPLLLNGKFQFTKQGAIGAMGEIGLDNTGNFFSLYFAWQEGFKASGIGSSGATFLVGYTFNNAWNINFAIGFQRNFLIPQLYIVADFSNFPYKYGVGASYANDHRGILNAGLRFILTDFFSLDFVGLDLMDANRSLMVGGNLYLGLWGGRR